MRQITYGYTENEMNAIYIEGRKAAEWQDGDDPWRIVKELTQYLNTEMKLSLKLVAHKMRDTNGAAMPDFIP